MASIETINATIWLKS